MVIYNVPHACERADKDKPTDVELSFGMGDPSDSRTSQNVRRNRNQQNTVLLCCTLASVTQLGKAGAETESRREPRVTG